MIVEIDPRSAVPPFEQLRTQIAALISSRRLGPGERLPTVRQLARDLGLAANTVARAYRELEAEGLVATRGRHGTFVELRPPVMSAADRSTELAELARAFASSAHRLGADLGAAVSAVERVWPTEPVA